MAVVPRWVNIANIVVSIILLGLGLAVVSIGAAASNEFLSALNRYSSGSNEYKFALSLFTSGTAHYIVAATVLIPASFGLAAGTSGSKAVYILYIVMDLLTFIAAIALLAWHCVWAIQLNVLYDPTDYVLPKRLTIILLALVSGLVGFGMLAAIFGIIGACSKPKQKHTSPPPASPPTYQMRESSFYKPMAWRDEYEDQGQGWDRQRDGGEVYQPWEMYYADSARRPR